MNAINEAVEALKELAEALVQLNDLRKKYKKEHPIRYFITMAPCILKIKIGHFFRSFGRS